MRYNLFIIKVLAIGGDLRGSCIASNAKGPRGKSKKRKLHLLKKPLGSGPERQKPHHL